MWTVDSLCFTVVKYLAVFRLAVSHDVQNSAVAQDRMLPKVGVLSSGSLIVVSLLMVEVNSSTLGMKIDG